MRNKLSGSARIRNVETDKRESFAGLALISLRITEPKSYRNFEPGKNFPINPMKTLLIASLCSVTLVLTSFGQTSPPPPPQRHRLRSARRPPPRRPLPTATPAVPGAPSPATSLARLAPPLRRPPRVAVAAAAAATAAPRLHPMHAEPNTGNVLVDNFIKGGYIMWPILLVSIVAIAVVLERIFWWLFRWMRRDPKRIEKVFTAIESRRRGGSLPSLPRFARSGSAHDLERLESPARVAAGRACRWPPVSRSNAPAGSSW